VPETLQVPSGRRVKLEYGAAGTVEAAVKFQELFGLAESSRLGRGNTGSDPADCELPAWVVYDRPMLILQVNVRVKTDQVNAFCQATLANSLGSLAEPGVARFDVLQNEEDPTRFMLIEVYRQREAIAAHKETPHYRAWVEAVTPMMAEPRTRSWWTSVHPDDAG